MFKILIPQHVDYYQGNLVIKLPILANLPKSRCGPLRVEYLSFSMDPFTLSNNSFSVNVYNYLGVKNKEHQRSKCDVTNTSNLFSRLTL